MLHKISERLTISIFQDQISEEQLELYIYGFELLLSQLGNLAVLGLAMLLSRRPIELLLFCVTFIPLRQYAGGYHASTALGCLSVWVVVLTLFSITLLLLPPSWILPMSGAILLLAEVIMWKLAPVSHPNKPLNEGERGHYRKMSRLLSLCAGVLVLIVMILFPAHLFAFSLAAGLLCASLALFTKRSRCDKYKICS